MKFSTVDGTQGPLRRAKFHDNRYHTNFNTGIFAGKETFPSGLWPVSHREACSLDASQPSFYF